MRQPWAKKMSISYYVNIPMYVVRCFSGRLLYFKIHNLARH